MDEDPDTLGGEVTGGRGRRARIPSDIGDLWLPEEIQPKVSLPLPHTSRVDTHSCALQLKVFLCCPLPPKIYFLSCKTVLKL